MIRFNNDYNRGALESILDGLTEINAASYAGYGEDQWCGRAEAVIKKLIAREDAMIKFVPGATQANIVAIAAALSPVQSVIAADTGHINCHEAASIESTGHKILGLPNTNGKLTSRRSITRAAPRSTLRSPSWYIFPSPPSRAPCIPRGSFAPSARSAKNTACTCSWTGPGWGTAWGQRITTLP